MYQLSQQERHLLRNLGQTEIGKEFAELLDKMILKVDSVSDITGDYGAKVEGKKIAKEFVKMIRDGMDSRTIETDEVHDNFE